MLDLTFHLVKEAGFPHPGVEEERNILDISLFHVHSKEGRG